MSGVVGRGLGYVVAGSHLLEDVDLDAAAGELVAVVGPNGAGKTTLLRLLAGDSTPTTGSVEILGRALSKLNPMERARLRAVLPQHTLLAFAFRCLDVVLMGRYAADAADDTTVVERVMSATDTTPLRERLYPTLSGGEQTRVSLARVLAQETPVLFLDEPTASLDLRHQELVLGALRGLADAGGIVVGVLHDLNLAARYADRIVLLSGGKVAAAGRPAEVLRAEIIEAVYQQSVSVVPHPVLGSPLVLPH